MQGETRACTRFSEMQEIVEIPKNLCCSIGTVQISKKKRKKYTVNP